MERSFGPLVAHQGSDFIDDRRNTVRRNARRRTAGNIRRSHQSAHPKPGCHDEKGAHRSSHGTRLVYRRVTQTARQAGRGAGGGDPVQLRPVSRHRITSSGIGVVLLFLLWASSPLAQAPANVVARPIDPRGVALPSEAQSAGETRFAFIAYGDTRGPADGLLLQAGHQDVVDGMLAAIPEQAKAGFPVRFVVQSGDAVVSGQNADQWDISFTPLIERLVRDGQVPYFFAVGNHDVGILPMHSPPREAGFRNTASAMSRLWPPEGSPRRLNGYPTFAFGYGRYFFVALDSNIAADTTQFNWVKSQLESLDRQRYRHVVAFFHHPPLTTGPHGGPLVEPQSQSIRQLYLPLFRRHHVRMTITGHDHFFDHFIERYREATGPSYRIDHIVSGGGGAPIYTYRGEQDPGVYAQTAAPTRTEIEHHVRPSAVEADNPHHFVIFEVDGDRIWLRVVPTVAAPFGPLPTRIELADRE